MSTIDVETLRKWLAEGRPVTLLDVRQQTLYQEWAIPGSVHADVYDALKAGDPHALDTLDLPSDRPIVTVCGVGKAAATAAEQLSAKGYAAFSLEGGMRAWSLAWNEAAFVLPSGTEVIQVRRTGKGCLAYLIGSAGAAAVIDAALEPQVYQQLAEQHSWQIVAVLDTHIHADHLSRSRALAAATGATLYLPAQERASFPFTPLREGEGITVGNARIDVLHTPGHTLESTSYLLDDALLFTGDTLFLAAVGRPDLEATPDAARERARLLFASLRRLTALPEQLLVAPGHTSAPVPFDGVPLTATLSEVRQAIPRLQLDEAAFVEELLSRIPPTPPNHHTIVQRNEAGAPIAENAAELEAGANRCAIA